MMDPAAGIGSMGSGKGNEKRNEIMKGIAYGVGVGPGDPELMTLKAVRLIEENDVIAVPGKEPREAVAYRIAAGAVPGIADKELVPVDMPMVRDRALMAAEHRKAAKLLEAYLEAGRNVVYLTLGDPTVYCSFSYIQSILQEDGYRVELVSGISSFCAAAARLGLPLVMWDEQLHVVPAVHTLKKALEEPGTCVLMKTAGRMKEVRERLQNSRHRVWMVENCGMENEKVYRGLEQIPEDAGYLSLIIAKGQEADRV